MFGSGEYQPSSPSGQLLLAHELTHVIQQGNGGIASVQRATCELGSLADPRCGDAQGSGHPEGVTLDRFDPDRIELKPSHHTAIGKFKATWDAGRGRDDVEIHGYASCDGAGSANADLSCRRAEAVKAELIKRGVTTKVTTFAHGETDEFGASLEANRRAIISTGARLTPTPPSPRTPTPAKPYPVTRVWVNSFIPMERIEGPPLSACFAGDNREFSDGESASSRTHQLIEVTPGMSDPTLSERRIGTSHEVTCDTGRVIGEATASTDSLSNSTILGQRTSAQADIFFSANASNPLVALAPAINLEAVFRLNLATRRCEFHIDHDGFPAYEVYIAAEGTPATTVYTYDPRPAGEDPTALFPPMNKSGSRSVSF